METGISLASRRKSGLAGLTYLLIEYHCQKERIFVLTKISLKGVASYKKEAILQTDKKVNLLYGLNGTGKSTLSEFLYAQKSSRFSECTIEGLNEGDSVLVYNQKFIQDTFYESEDIHGIFTLSKGNAKAKKIIDSANKEIAKLTEQKKNIEEKQTKGKQEYSRKEGEYKEKVWKIKTEFTGGDRVLAFCLDGYKNSKDSLFNHLITIEKPNESINYSVDDLKKEAQSIQGEVQSKQLFSEIKIDVVNIEKSNLLGKVIIGNKDSAVASLIEKLGNSDWVNEGIQYVQMEDDETARCPFCQQKTITRAILNQIRKYFDESYNQDKTALEQFVTKYDNELQNALNYLEQIKADDFFIDRENEFETLITNLKAVMEKNINLLKEKVRTPSTTIELISISEIETKINSLIREINKTVSAFNQRIADIQGSKNTIKQKFWKLMREKYNDVIELYNANKASFNQEKQKIQLDITQIDKEINENRTLIEENRKKTVNIDEAVENIKNGLIDIGITDFTIEKHSEEDALYRLKRDNADEDVFKTLSEGEKMVISFLYFIELCKGESVAENVSNNKIVVIDDPISSLSHIYVFNIGRLIQNEFLRTEKYNQIFVLTHSLYFFYELTNIKHDERKETQKLFRICKNLDGSYFEDMKYEEIQNDYQAYWHIIKDSKQSPALIANCMRNIIEYFFNFVEKQDFAQIFERKELQKTSFMAFNRYMNRESHSKGQNIFDLKEFDYDSFREAFEKVFEIEGYIDHYNKMIKKC